MQTIWLARHANRLDFVNPDWFNTAPRRYDPPLSDDGLIQANRLAQRLSFENIKGIFASPFLRAIQTAHAVANLLELEIKIESGLSEWLNPDWMTHLPETAPISELKALFPNIDASYESKVKPQYPETECEVLSRASLTAQLLATEYRDNILLVAHSASVAGCVRGLSIETFSADKKVPLCSLYKFVRDDFKWLCELEADTSHLNRQKTQTRFN